MLTPSYSPVAQPILQPISQPVIRTISQPVIQTITQPVLQPMPQTVLQPVPQSVIQPVVPQNIPPGVPQLQLQQPNQPPAQPWKIKFPAIISGILSFFQLVLAIAIIGCEVGSILIDMITSTIYVGLWAGIFFLIAAISLAVSSCCVRTHGLATYTLVIQCVCLLFAACVIGFDAYFLSYPSTCFYPTSTCTSTGTSRGLFYSTSNFNNIKTPLIIAQLAAGGVMFVLCLIYIAIYVITVFRVHKVKTPPMVYPQAPYSMAPVPTGPDGMIAAPPITQIRPPRITSPLYHRPTMVVDSGDGRTNDLLCPTCNTTMAVSVRKRP